LAPGALFLCLLAWSPSGSALDKNKSLSQYTLEVWKTEQGLPVNGVTKIAQTQDGYLWLGTQSGLVRFDGISCQTYTRRNTPQLKTSIVTSVLATRDGALWIGLEDGGVVVKHEDDFVPLRPELLATRTVSALYEDPSGAIWIGADDGTIYSWSNDQLQQMGDEAGLGGQVRAFLSDDAGGVWAAIEGTGAWCFHQDGSITHLSTAQGLPNNVVISLGSSSDGALWIGTHSGGVARVLDDQVTLLTTKDGLSNNTVQSIIEDTQRNLWIATQRGLCRLSEENKVTGMTTRQDLGANDVGCLLEDREGSLWIGTRGGGLCRLKDSPVTTFGVREGLDFDLVWTVMEDSHGDLWIGTGGGGLFRMRGTTISRAYAVANGLSHDTVLSLCEAADGALWVGTRRGLNRIHEGVVERFFTGDGLPDDFVRVLSADQRGRIWIGTRSGIALYEDGRFSVYDGDGSLGDEVIRYIHHAHDATVWIGTNGNGLIHVSTSGMTRLTTDDGLSSGFVFALYEDAQGTIWAGTNEGLNRIRNGRIGVLTQEEGLPDDFIYRILDDDTGRVWISTNVGIVSVPLENLNRALDSGGVVEGARTFGTADGMLTQECNGGVQPAGWRDRAKRLWFPTGQGVVRVDPTTIYYNTVAPTVDIQRVVATPGGTQTVTDGRAVLEPGTSRFELHYAALSLLNPARVRYRYRLEGLEDDWTAAGTRRTAYYTNVGPGRYLFRVAGCNNDGVWSTADATLSIVVRPKLYQTGWMALLVVLAASGLVVAAFKLRTRQLRRRQQQLITLVEERTKLLQDANRKLEVLVNKDGLTGITNRRHFMERFELEWKRSSRTSTWISVIFADIDHFKAYNDTFGHQAGDDCLRQVAHILNECAQRPADLVARYGGEEFVALLPETDAQGAYAVAESMRCAVLELRLPHAEPAQRDVVSVSFGVASIQPRPESQSTALLERADEALYQAKEQGRNRTVGVLAH